MIDFIFGFLESIGFTHPLHPALVHVPMGMIMGGFAFALAAVIFKRPVFHRTAFHCATLALIAIPPTVLLGIMDWQYSFDGQWLTPIKTKMTLAFIMTVLLIVLHIIGRNADKIPYRFLAVFGLTFLVAIGMGYTGGQLIFG